MAHSRVIYRLVQNHAQTPLSGFWFIYAGMGPSLSIVKVYQQILKRKLGLKVTGLEATFYEVLGIYIAVRGKHKRLEAWVKEGGNEVQ